MKATAYVHAYVNHGHNAGAETTLHDLLRAMVSEGWDVDVILSQEIPGLTEGYTIDGIRVLPYTDKRQVIHAANSSNLLISHLECSERVAVVGRRYRVPTCQVIHNNMDITKAYTAHGWDLLVFNTQWVAQDFAETAFKAPQSHAKAFSVVHPRVDIHRYDLGPQDGSERAYDVALVNLWEGTGKGDGKGAHTFYEMARRFPDKKFLGVIGGYGEQSIVDLDNVTVVPHTSAMVEDVYSQTRVLLMPSRYESFGRVAIEGASCGIPTIVSPTPGLMEAMGSDWRYVAAPDDYDTWELSIRLLDDPHLYKVASEAATDRAIHWHDHQRSELEDFLAKADHAARLGQQLRGF